MISALTQFHESAGLVTLAQKIPGRIVLWCAAMLLLYWHDSNALMLAALTLVMLFPARKRTFLALAALGIVAGFDSTLPELLAVHTTASNLLNRISNASFLLVLLFLAFLLVLHFDKWPAIIRKFPLVALHTVIWILLILSTLPMLGFLVNMDFFAWRLSFLVVLGSRGKIAGTKFRDHLFYLAPVFGGYNTPIGKGLDFLGRHEAGDPASFARSQLAGIKLLILAGVWQFSLELMDAVIFGKSGYWLTDWSADLPPLSRLIVHGTGHAWYLGWLVIYLELIRAVLSLAVMGHVIVGSLRLLGFNVFRNTYKPLLAESIVEFWNRYFFYFKELLVEFFFYPTYLRLRSTGPRVRLLAAVFAAAFLGNMYFHILEVPQVTLNSDFGTQWELWCPRLFYCFFLAFGIWISMLRQQRIRQTGSSPGWLLRLRRIAGVWTFYSIIHIWNLALPDVSFLQRCGFFASLFGL